MGASKYPYIKSLRQEFGDEFLIRDWFTHASDLQRVHTAGALEVLVQELPAALGGPSDIDELRRPSPDRRTRARYVIGYGEVRSHTVESSG